MVEVLKTAIALLAVGMAVSQARAARVDIEAEAFVNSTCSGAAAIKTQKPDPWLSGGLILSHDDKDSGGATYRLSVPEKGLYNVYAKEHGWSRNGLSAIRWRIDDGPWQRVEQTWGLPGSHGLAGGEWIEWGRIEIPAGEHIFEWQTADAVFRAQGGLPPPQSMSKADMLKSMTGRAAEPLIIWQNHRASIDAFIFSTEPVYGLAEHARLVERLGRRFALSPEQQKQWVILPSGVDDFRDSILDRITPSAPIGNGPESILRREGDQFVRADGRPFVALGMSAPVAPSRADADYYARRMRRLGLNVARIHSLQGELCSPRHGKGYVIDEQKFERMMYFISRLKAEGVYVMLDPLYNWCYPMTESDGLDKGEYIPGRINWPFYFDPRLAEKNRQFIRELLTRKNPHTGIALGNDPAVAFMEVVNENSMFFWFVDNSTPGYQRQLDELWTAFLKERYKDQAALAAAWGKGLEAREDLAAGTVRRLSIGDVSRVRKAEDPANNRIADQTRFYAKIQTDFYQGIRKFVREDLGFGHILVHGSGWKGVGRLNNAELFTNADGMDFIDQHAYGPIDFVVGDFAGTQIGGMPWMASEWNNNFHLIGAAGVPAYGALHGWDGLFQYRTDAFDGWRGVDRGTSPAIYLQYPLASLAYVHRLIRTDDVVWRAVLSEDSIHDATAAYTGPGPLAFAGRCEIAIGQDKPMADDIAGYTTDGAIRSKNGDLTWKGTKNDGTILLRAPAMQGLLGTAADQPVDCGEITVDLPAGQVVAVMVAAADGQSLSQSKRMLLGAFGQTRHMDQIDEADPAKIRRNTNAPVCMQRVNGTVRFKQPVKAVRALDLGGQPIGDLPLADEGRTVRIDHVQGAVWFEIVR